VIGEERKKVSAGGYESRVRRTSRRIRDVEWWRGTAIGASDIDSGRTLGGRLSTILLVKRAEGM
jgi:hypothetical protein